ncbi:hypothetical protein SmJEL517_g03335 [Synchytrium microbalum]|uniref:CCR4-NOT transcription complex subunit 11 n=1 Tax=Synchytrium microbalum TaxID=1806994 RepID=A0A507C7B6_9FUNG|nr:uncharacterized protein SmJEL517_g03335 [Synchytrium microbalum]TPX33886.1 hypothetical protein SmJEL517_g03335 [Synchytrium microbalum]
MNAAAWASNSNNAPHNNGKSPPATGDLSNIITSRDLDYIYNALSNTDTQMVSVAVGLSRVLSVNHHVCATALAVLLKERVLLPSPILRIQALFLLWYYFRTTPVSQHPFLKTFLDYSDQSTDGMSNNLAISWCERWVVRSILYEEYTPLASVSARSLIERITPSEAVRALLDPNYPSLLKEMQEQVDKDARNLAPGFMLISPEPGAREPALVEALTAAKQLFEAVGPGNHSQLLGFQPNVDPGPPPPLSFTNQVIWIEPKMPIHQLEWDYNLGIDLAKRDEARKLILLGYSVPLSITQLQKIMRQLERHPKLVFDCGLSPDKIPDLVENNPNVASEVLIRLMGSAKISEYLQVLVNVNMSLRSMEVVNRLATSSSGVPPEFIHLYITNCIQNCETIRDKYMQNRQVRLVCVFLQSLIRNRIVTTNDDLVEISTFCVQFSRIREAAALYRLLKKEEVK